MIGAITERAKGKALASGFLVAALMAACLLLTATPAHARPRQDLHRQLHR
jgi:hypothetical protein